MNQKVSTVHKVPIEMDLVPISKILQIIIPTVVKSKSNPTDIFMTVIDGYLTQFTCSALNHLGFK